MISEHHRNRRPYNWLIYDAADRFLERFVPYYRGVLYDLGAGEAPYREFFLRHVDQYVAVDWASSAHELQADLLADLNGPLPIASGVADTVVSLSVLEHLHAPQAMLREACRILRPGGWMILQVPWQWWIHEAPHDYFRYTPFALRRLLGQAGFVDVQVEAQAGFFTMLTLKLNYFSLRLLDVPRRGRRVLRRALGVVWYLDQKLAPVLDRLDERWELEATGYFVIARKP
jgi:SAM-dependent methyltransferase